MVCVFARCLVLLFVRPLCISVFDCLSLCLLLSLSLCLLSLSLCLSLTVSLSLSLSLPLSLFRALSLARALSFSLSSWRSLFLSLLLALTPLQTRTQNCHKYTQTTRPGHEPAALQLSDTRRAGSRCHTPHTCLACHILCRIITYYVTSSHTRARTHTHTHTITCWRAPPPTHTLNHTDARADLLPMVLVYSESGTCISPCGRFLAVCLPSGARAVCVLSACRLRAIRRPCCRVLGQEC